MTALFLFIIISSLPVYEVIVDPLLLEQLYSEPFSDLEAPAVVSHDGISADCTIAFRGGSSLWCSKKSWHIRLNDADTLPTGGHILLNAQFRDPSMMRNTIGLYLTRRLGFPASETEFCLFSINGDNQGVYEHVEAIDRLFYERNGLSVGPLFKSVDAIGRLSLHFSDLPGTAGFEPKIDSDPYKNELLHLIEDCFREDVSSLQVDEILGAFAVQVAIGDQDGIIKNFYLHKCDDVWHYYPWDRDASLGNSWQGCYDSLWTTRSNQREIGLFGATRGILSDWENRQNFNSIMSTTIDLLMNDLPGVVDSLRLHIRSDLASDPFYQYEITQFDSLCSILIEDIQERAVFLSDYSLLDEIPQVLNITISSCLDIESTVNVILDLNGQDPHGVVCMVSFNNQNKIFRIMNQTSPGESWTLAQDIPPETYSVHIAFGTFSLHDRLLVFYPSWAMINYQDRPEPTPSARVALAYLSPQLLSIGSPVWRGLNLWVLPVTNTSAEFQDLSLCRFVLGEPTGNIFMAESILINPGETFYLTNSSENAEILYGECNIFGDAGTSYPEGTVLTLMDPSWNSIHCWTISNGDSLPETNRFIIPSEISAGAGAGDDWIELVNFTESSIDLSGWYFRDSDYNISLFPDNTILSSGEILLASVQPYSFENSNFQVIPLDFHLNSEEDLLSLYTPFGDQVFSFGWNNSWPIIHTGIMYLKSPEANFTSLQNWEAATLPGSPGDLNPGWSFFPGYMEVTMLSPNPCNGFFFFRYQSSAAVVEAGLFDIAGRLVANIDLQNRNEGTIQADFAGSLPSGIYILFLKSSAGATSVRFTILAE